jgi:hypothetical protein
MKLGGSIKTCLNKTYIEVRTGKYCNIFLIQNGFKKDVIQSEMHPLQSKYIYRNLICLKVFLSVN